MVSYLQVGNCHDSVIYILAPLRYATIYGCSDATIVLGAVGKVLMKMQEDYALFFEVLLLFPELLVS